MRRCLFCENQADSDEHIIPMWLLKILPAPGRRFRFKVGNKNPVEIPTMERTVKAVCQTCNEGWMSALEVEAAPMLRSLAYDISRRIDEASAKALALWSMKTAMINETSVRRKQPSFMKGEYARLLNHEMPSRSFVWLGRFYKGNDHDVQGTDFPIMLNGIDKAAMGTVTTFLLGHLVMQALHITLTKSLSSEWPETITSESKPGPWSTTLQQIWPYEGNVMWPPPEGFTIARGSHHYKHLADRWRVGQRMPMKEISISV